MEDQQTPNGRWLSSSLLNFACIFAVAAAMIYYNGGIGVGTSNHVGQLPVVRRILDPNYLPGDFNIALRFYHHRAFSYLVAGGSALLGEDRALVVLGVLAMVALSAALFGVCRTLGLSRWGFLVVGAMAATRFAWTDRGLELNEFLGDPEIMPPPLAHAALLLALTALIKERYRLAMFFTGLVILAHLQIGLTFALMTAPLYLIKIRELGTEPGAVATWLPREGRKSKEPGRYRSRFRNSAPFSSKDLVKVKEALVLAALLIVPASPALWHVGHMFKQGLATSPVPASFYIDFRHPHHFELLSITAAVWVVIHLIVIVLAYGVFRRRDANISRGIGRLLVCCVTLALLCLIHFTDYYLIKNDKLAQVQFLRLSPLITALGAVCFVLLVNGWPKNQRLVALANVVLIAASAGWAWASPRRLETPYYFGVRRFAEEKSSWVDVALWVKANGPRDAVYLAPPGNNGFSVLSDRSIVAEFKLNPDGAMYQAEWFERLRDLAGGQLPAGRGFENRKLLNKAFAKLDNEQLLALSRKYNAAYAVLPKESRASFEVVYQNREYRVVKLPPGFD
jgi:hypothetical protein